MSKLFSPVTLRGLTLRNRTVVAPMCQYSAIDGFANDWHFVHLGRFALGGFGLVIVEATGVLPEARISYGDLGLWKDEHIAPLARIVDFLHANGAAAGIQLAHAGRKAATPIPWRNGFDETAADKVEYAFEDWTPVAPSALSHNDADPNYKLPIALDRAGMDHVRDGFVAPGSSCPACGHVQHYPRPWCTNCLHEAPEFVEASGEGTIYTFTVIRRSPLPAFAARVPYVLAFVDLDEGVRLVTNVVECDPDTVRIGQRVRARFEAIDGEHTIVLFAPLDSAPG